MAIPFAAIGAAISLGSSIYSAIEARKQEKDFRASAKDSRRRMNALLEQYRGLDTSNPFLNMENTMEDLTVNQQASQFQAQQFQQSQANILSNLRPVAGGSGIAALAQSLARQGEIAAQRSAASIAQQEAANDRAAAAESARIQNMERQGEIYSRNLQRQKTETLLGMSQQETAAYLQNAGAARTQMMSGIASAGMGAAQMFAGFGGGERPLFELSGGTPQNTGSTGQVISTSGGLTYQGMDTSNLFNFNTNAGG